MAITYPVAATADAALHSPLGFAAREREAAQLASSLVASAEVEFVTQAVGPAFTTREAALDAYAGRVDDERPGRVAIALEGRWCKLRAVSTPVGVSPKPRAPVRPACRGGRRWPEPDTQRAPVVLWRLSVSYWRFGGDAAAHHHIPARKLRRHAASKDLDGATLGALARQPLQAIRPQQALDIGLFEYRPPDDPSIILPDE
jgi:hypothetical protein